jgi:hypothetical protein
VSTNVSDIDEIAVTVPAERRFLGVVNLVLGGLCTRLDFPYEQVDDLQLAVDSVLAPGRPQGGVVTLEAEADEDRLRLRLGPLAAGTAAHPGLQRVLDPLVGSAEAVERDGAEWIAMDVERRTAGAQAG